MSVGGPVFFHLPNIWRVEFTGRRQPINDEWRGEEKCLTGLFDRYRLNITNKHNNAGEEKRNFETGEKNPK